MAETVKWWLYVAYEPFRALPVVKVGMSKGKTPLTRLTGLFPHGIYETEWLALWEIVSPEDLAEQIEGSARCGLGLASWGKGQDAREHCVLAKLEGEPHKVRARDQWTMLQNKGFSKLRRHVIECIERDLEKRKSENWLQSYKLANEDFEKNLAMRALRNLALHKEVVQQGSVRANQMFLADASKALAHHLVGLKPRKARTTGQTGGSRCGGDGPWTAWLLTQPLLHSRLALMVFKADTKPGDVQGAGMSLPMPLIASSQRIGGVNPGLAINTIFATLPNAGFHPKKLTRGDGTIKIWATVNPTIENLDNAWKDALVACGYTLEGAEKCNHYNQGLNYSTILNNYVGLAKFARSWFKGFAWVPGIPEGGWSRSDVAPRRKMYRWTYKLEEPVKIQFELSITEYRPDLYKPICKALIEMANNVLENPDMPYSVIEDDFDFEYKSDMLPHDRLMEIIKFIIDHLPKFPNLPEQPSKAFFIPWVGIIQH